ncbi:hypothetical protein SAMN05216390_10194 [Lachnospiraceae bacterium KH1T2]|nr:hypothetical protein SAMN05216390_10194 [Lachnospiraceae bacterium KH1T2]
MHDLNVSDIYFNVTAESSAFVGGIAGFMDSDAEDDNSGAVIDNVKTSGKISVYSTKSNSFAAGIAAYQFKGAIINSSSDMDISCIVKDEALAEVGSIVGLNNRGLNANLYSTGKIYGSGSRENGLEGMAVVSGIAGVQAGSEVNCYTDADLETAEYSIYAGMLSGWITGIGKTYDSWFDKNASMVIDGKSVNPPESVGTVVAPDVSDEDGTAYVGGLTKDIKSYDADSYKSIAVSMNELFEEFPVDITEFGLSASALRRWKYDEASKRVVFDTAYGTVKYVKPEVENVKEETVSANNGTWYGRSEDKSTVVKIVVKNNEIESTEVLSGNDSGEKFDEAFKKAKEKAVYGDFTDYEAADTSKFAGGEGTEEKPYLISNEEQLRYLAESINEDVNWKGVWFRQTADITLSDKEWLPIGRSLQVRVNGSPSIVAIYPFRGSFDGGNHVIKNLKMGTEAEPYNGFSVGLFGVTEGDFNSNKLQSASVNRVTLKNIKLRDVDINAEIEMATRAGGLIGAGEDGIFIDNCSVTGNIEVNTQDSYDQVGSVAGYLLRGSMLNTWSDVELKAFANKSTVYAGGIMGMQNRVTTVNCYSLGDVSVGSGNNNKATAGGIVGLDGGVIVNSYASGNVSSSKTTFDLGIISGRAAGISEERGNYYNSDAEILNQGTEIEARPIGTDVTKSAVSNNFARSAEFMAGSEFADELNANRLGISRILNEVKEELGTDEDGNSAGHSVYYNGDGSELREWEALNGIVGFEEVSPEEPTPSENTTEPSISGNNAEPSATSGNSAVSGNGTASGNGAVSGNDTASGNKAVSENDAVSANEIVSTVTKKLSDDVSVTYKETVSFNGKKTVFGAEDITVTVDGAEYKGDKLKLRYKNNQKAGEATFYIKGIKGASKAQRKLLKQVKKTALTFKVDKLALTGENAEIRLSKSGAVKSVKAVVNGKKLKLKKSEYSANAGIITISGERFSGELKY